MSRVLLLATTTGYQTRAFADAAERLGVDLIYATDRCNVLEDPWRDQAIPIRFFDENAAIAAILEQSVKTPIDGVLAVGDRPTVIAAGVLEILGLPGHPPGAAAAARNKLLTRERLRDAGLPVPAFVPAGVSDDAHELARSMTFPVVVKPLMRSGSRGVIRADNQSELVAAFYRLRALLQAPDIRAERSDADDSVVVEGFIEGREFAIEGILEHGALRLLAIFDKPDPLDGPFFEETIYVTPSAAPADVQAAIAESVTLAARALGLRHGPIHAECRVQSQAGGSRVFVLEVAARPIGGLCARALRFASKEEPGPLISLEELLLRHALGESAGKWQREAAASGVMMIPIPRRGVFRRVGGIDEARQVCGVEDVRITAKADQVLVPLPEGASYLGFIFAHAAVPADVERALRAAHRRLKFTIDPEVPVLQSHHHG
jgi:biotin carboxylase